MLRKYQVLTLKSSLNTSEVFIPNSNVWGGHEVH